MKEQTLRKVKLSDSLKKRLKETKTWEQVMDQFKRGTLRTFAGYNRRGGLKRGNVVKNKFQAYYIAVSMAGKELGYRVVTK